MTSKLPVTLSRFFFILALAIWLGGIIAIGALSAPVTFYNIRHTATINIALEARNMLAGDIVGSQLRIFNYISYICGAILLIAASAINNQISQKQQRVWKTAIILIALLLLISIYLGFGLFPVMDHYRQIRDMVPFDNAHHLYQWLVELQMPILMILIFQYAWATSDKQS